jgi:hypothetical protein
MYDRREERKLRGISVEIFTFGKGEYCVETEPVNMMCRATCSDGESHPAL